MIRKHNLARGAALSWLLSATIPALAQDVAAAAVKGEKPFTDRGLLVWQGRSTPSLPSLAGVLAPVLWFSPDEPLLLKGSLLPHRHPCDPNPGDGVVYYQVARIRLPGPVRVTTPEHEDREFFDKVDSFTIRFYFYYDRDFGVGRHAHDLEVVEMEVSLGSDDVGRREARLRRVIGLAHGTDWYSNELHVEPDTRVPLTVLVEEGKHASAPDRNADGIYTPGYDVNRRISDAWGIRDVLGSGFLTAGAYQATMAKPRRPSDRRAPPAVEDARPSSILSSHDRHDPALKRYRLSPAAGVPRCQPDGAEPDRLVRMMRAHRFGREFSADQYEIELLRELAEPLTGTGSIFPSIGARWDRSIGGTVQLRGADLRLLYVVPKINWVRRDVGVEALFTTSAARVHSTYLSLGVAREHLPPGKQPAQAEWNPTVEAGLKFRTRLEGRRRVFSLGYQFAGVRFGIRYSGFETVKLTRMIVEVGPGVW
jgi:hypothetical protein